MVIFGALKKKGLFGPPFFFLPRENTDGVVTDFWCPEGDQTVAKPLWDFVELDDICLETNLSLWGELGTL